MQAHDQTATWKFMDENLTKSALNQCPGQYILSPLTGPCQGGNIIKLIVKKSFAFKLNNPEIWFKANQVSTAKRVAADNENQEWQFEVPSTFQNECMNANFPVDVGIYSLNDPQSSANQKWECSFRNSYTFEQYVAPKSKIWLWVLIPTLLLALGLVLGIFWYKKKYKDSANQQINNFINDPDQYERQNSNFNQQVLNKMLSKGKKQTQSVLIDRKTLKNIKKQPIGEGKYGIVYYCPTFKKLPKRLNSSGEILDENTNLLNSGDSSSNPVGYACKAMKSKRAIGEILEEAKMMNKLMHPNIVKFIGVYVPDAEDEAENHPIFSKCMIVTEFLHNGDLETYLKNDQNRVTLVQLMKFCREAAAGLEYLSVTKKVTHRDLAARNCMLSSENVLKLSDFGLAREGENYQITSQEIKLPVPWMPIESIQGHNFSIETDLWMYGVLCWEIFTRCNFVPYFSFGVKSGIEILRFLQGNCRLPRPNMIPKDMYIRLVSMWHEDPSCRPSISKVKIWFDAAKVKNIEVTRKNCFYDRNQQTVVEYSIEKDEKPRWEEDDSKYVCKLVKPNLVNHQINMRVWELY